MNYTKKHHLGTAMRLTIPSEVAFSLHFYFGDTMLYSLIGAYMMFFGVHHSVYVICNSDYMVTSQAAHSNNELSKILSNIQMYSYSVQLGLHITIIAMMPPHNVQLEQK